MSSQEFEKFDAVVRKVFSVSHDEIVKREKQYKQKRRRARAKTQLKAKKESKRKSEMTTSTKKFIELTDILALRFE